MRNLGAGFRFTALALLAILGMTPALQAQSIQITDVKVGLPPGRFVTQQDDNGNPAYVVKSGVWAPVYVQLQMLKEEKRPAAIVIETTDADNLTVSLAVPLQNLSDLAPGTRIEPAELRFLPYARPSGRYDMTVSVRVQGEGKPTDWRLMSEPFRVRYLRTRDVAEYVVLSLGTKLPGFELPNEKAGTQEVDLTTRGLRGGRIETAAILNVNEMPDRWYGYEAADLVVLTTGATSEADFLTPLFTDPKQRHRLDALLEWVRRGGRLVVSVGTNAAIVSQYTLLQEILSVTIRTTSPVEQVKELELDWAIGSRNSRPERLTARQGATFAAANTVPKPDRGFRLLVPAYEAFGEQKAPRTRTVTQSAFGLGRITLLAFDLDRSPFIDFSARAQIWDLILKECGSSRASTGTARKTGYGYLGQGIDTEDEFAAGLREHLDQFEGVPVISFGWVALFILLYTLLIGPVEYVILKKVFKRLELTWISFPMIVITVSAAAYFTAYWLKGDSLMINKVDIIDVDAGSSRIYGKTWFSIFSPRIETYRIGIEPNDSWAAEEPEVPHPGSLVDWVGSSRGNARGGGFFRRSYSYRLATPDSTPGRYPFSNGLLDVPIQVWSTKPFSAEWSAWSSRKPALVESKLIHPPSDPRKVAGTFTLNLPMQEISDAYLIYAGKAYKQDNPIAPGRPVTVFLDKDDPNWLASLSNPRAIVQLGKTSTSDYRRYNATASAQLFGALFHDLQTPEDVAPTNSTLRRLDQSWRVSELNRDEVIVIGKLAPRRGEANDIIAATDSISPTRLWIKELPTRGTPWPGITGQLNQETYVRVYVPIQPAKQ